MISKRDYINTIEQLPDFSKRYWYAEYSCYYPCGFLDDVDATCDTLGELQSLKNKHADIFYLYDSILRVFIEPIYEKV